MDLQSKGAIQLIQVEFFVIKNVTTNLTSYTDQLLYLLSNVVGALPLSLTSL